MLTITSSAGTLHTGQFARTDDRAGMPTLNEGDRLEFELEVDRRGKYAAVNLQPKSD